MQCFMRLVAARFLEILRVQFLDLGVFVGFADHLGCIVAIQRLCAQGTQIVEVIYFRGLCEPIRWQIRGERETI